MRILASHKHEKRLLGRGEVVGMGRAWGRRRRGRHGKRQGGGEVVNMGRGCWEEGRW